MSKWDKLVSRVCSLSADIRFSELQKILESYGYTIHAQEAAAAITHSANRAKAPLQFQSMIL